VPAQSFDEGLDNLVVRHRPMCCGIPQPRAKKCAKKKCQKKVLTRARTVGRLAFPKVTERGYKSTKGKNGQRMCCCNPSASGVFPSEMTDL
jgi:hypothetical protein